MSVQIPPTVPAGWAPSWNEQYQTWSVPPHTALTLLTSPLPPYSFLTWPRYYINTKSKQSQWEKPTSPVATRPPSPARDGDGDDKLSPLVASAASEVDKMSAQFESTQIESSQQGTVAGSAPPEVPAGWLAKWNESYQTWFYYNMVTKGSTWERPTVPVEGASSTSTTTVSHAVTTTAATATAAAAPQVGESAAPRSSRVTASEPVSREPSSKEPQSREETPIVPNGWSAQWNDMYRAWYVIRCPKRGRMNVHANADRFFRFYVNTVTEETTWECPALTVDRPAPVTPAPSSNAHRPPPSLSPQPSLSGRASVHSQGPSGVPEVPSGWAARFNDQYQTW